MAIRSGHVIRLTMLVALLGVVALRSPAVAGNVDINVAQGISSGLTVRGPSNITIYAINPVRYVATLSSQVTIGTTPDASSAVSPTGATPSSSTKPISGLASPQPKLNIQSLNTTNAYCTFEPEPPDIAKLLSRLTTFQSSIKACFQKQVDQQTKTEQRIKFVSNIIDQTLVGFDTAKSTDSETRLPDSIKPVLDDLAKDTDYTSYRKSGSAAISGLGAVGADQLALLQEKMEEYCVPDKSNKIDPRCSSAQKQLDADSSFSTSLLTGTDAQAYLRHDGIINSWTATIDGLISGGQLNLSAFKIAKHQPCSEGFVGSQDVTIQITLQDQFRAYDGSTETPKPVDLVTVHCSSPISLTFGLGFSTAYQRTPIIKAGRFAYTEGSTGRLFPVTMANVLLWNPNDTVAVHYSVGAILVNDASTNTSILELLTGPTLSFKDSMFLTLGVDLTHVLRLGQGFTEGELVPPGVTTAPTESAARAAFGISFTYRKP